MPTTYRAMSKESSLHVPRNTRSTRKRVYEEVDPSVKKNRSNLEGPKTKATKASKLCGKIIPGASSTNEKEEPLPDDSNIARQPEIIEVDPSEVECVSSSSSAAVEVLSDTDSPPRTLKLSSILSPEASPLSRPSGSTSRQYHDPLEQLSPSLLTVPEGVIDIYNEGKSGKPSSPDYLQAYVQYMWCLENDISVRPNMERRKVPCSTVTVDMRRVLVDWMFDISQEYRAQTTTLYLAVTLLDRALDSLAVRREKLQLLGCACFLIAAKIEEVTAPTVEGMLDISARSYEHREMVECEMVVSNALSFRLTGVTAAHFLDHFLKVAQFNPKQEALAKYLCDLALLDYSFVGLLPSLVAASVIYLTRQTTIKCRTVDDVWSPSLRFYTKYESCHGELRATVRKLRRAHHFAWDGAYAAVRRKYQTPENFHVSELLCISEDDLIF